MKDAAAGPTAAAPTAPRPAATLILVRGTAGIPEVLLLKRSATAAFMPNAYVFAGGAVDPDDAAPEMLSLCAPHDDECASTTLGLADGGLAYYVAAIRECFEECGLLLAYDEAGKTVDLSEWDSEELRQLRCRLSAREVRLADVCRAMGWRLATDSLAYTSHWITPTTVKRRFDTRFFMALAPALQCASLAGNEMSDLIWRTAAEALAESERGGVLLMRATRSVLQEIAGFQAVRALLEFARSSRKIAATIPVLATAQLSPAD